MLRLRKGIMIKNGWWYANNLQMYTRAEHLRFGGWHAAASGLTVCRRHQKNHQGPPQLCNICNRPFYRGDLLLRHQQNRCGVNNRRRSSSDGDASSLRYSERQGSTQSTPPMMPSPPPTEPLPGEYKSEASATGIYASAPDYGPPPLIQPTAPFHL